MASQDTVDKRVEELESVVIRLAGDSGDGMQLTGGQFTRTTALFGNDISTLPDFPAEIRAPAGSLPGVSSFQLNFSSNDIFTPGDAPDVLVAMNPAALKVHLGDLEDGGILLVNTDAFSKTNLHKAGYDKSPLDDGSLSRYRSFKVPITSLNAKALDGLDMSQRQVDRSKNFWALGLLYWLYNRPLEGHPALPGGALQGIQPHRLRGQQARPVRRLQLRRHHGNLHHRVPRAQGAPAAGHLPQHYRRGGDGDGLRDGRAPARQTDLLHRLSDHPGQRGAARDRPLQAFWCQNVSGRGRDRRGVGGHRRRLRGQPGAHLHQRARRGPEERGDQPRAHGRVAPGDCRHPARRPEHWHAYQDRAGRPVAVHVWTQQRLGVRNHCTGDAGRLFLHGDRGVPAGGEIHDAGLLTCRTATSATAPSRGVCRRPATWSATTLFIPSERPEGLRGLPP